MPRPLIRAVGIHRALAEYVGVHVRDVVTEVAVMNFDWDQSTGIAITIGEGDNRRRHAVQISNSPNSLIQAQNIVILFNNWIDEVTDPDYVPPPSPPKIQVESNPTVTEPLSSVAQRLLGQ